MGSIGRLLLSQNDFETSEPLLEFAKLEDISFICAIFDLNWKSDLMGDHFRSDGTKSRSLDKPVAIVDGIFGDHTAYSLVDTW